METGIPQVSVPYLDFSCFNRYRISPQSDVCVPRLRVAFKWMVRAFSGYLSTDQLLLLWDRVLGFDSLEIVASKSSCTLLPLQLQTSYFYASDTHLFLFFTEIHSFNLLPLFPPCTLHAISPSIISPLNVALLTHIMHHPLVLAAAVFAFRAENLMEVTSLASAEVRLSEILIRLFSYSLKAANSQ